VVCSEGGLFLIVAQVAPLVARARKVVPPDNSLAAVVPCTRRAQRQAVLREQLVPVLGNAPAFRRVPDLAVHGQGWVVLQD
jgi:hypothetical protein